ncbi:MAG: hypothetical protein HC800_16030 [Phormidesmis sp. RL_2_1]|nr:hypothetical protein [Phormidesmis sp. RL_2_1]
MPFFSYLVRCCSSLPRYLPPYWPSCLFGFSVALGSPLWIQPAAIAQSGLPSCPPPNSGEYLLLVRGHTEADRADIATILPAENPVLICRYLNETLVRAGGFTSLETANAWATYMTTVEGYESFVSRPASAQTASEMPTSGESSGGNNASGNGAGSHGTSNSGTSNSGAVATVAYAPVRLADGYAVLVDYGDRPDVATAVGQIVGPVGLAVYQQRAYLLADYTLDAADAAITLQRLSDAQLAPILVDAQQVVRLSTDVVR